jgi:hypothetical protein
VVLWCDYLNQRIQLLQCKECKWALPKSCIQNTTMKT